MHAASPRVMINAFRVQWIVGYGRHFFLVILLILSGCAHTGHIPTTDDISEQLAQRTALGRATPARLGELIVPDDSLTANSLSEEQAVMIALWNNAAFHEILADLGIARGDLVQAGLLPNPEFIYFWPASDKPFKYAFEVPIEAFWLRPIRIAAASRELARTCDRLTQAALDLIRDTRQAFADVLLAQGRLKVAEEAVQIRSEIARLATARLDAGDISPQEAATAKIDALTATQDVARIRYDVTIVEERLRLLLGQGDCRTPLRLRAEPQQLYDRLEVESLTSTAVASRPDALAVDQAVAAAEERLRLARLVWVRVLGIGDASSGRSKGHEFGPAVRFTVPIFNWNQGNIGRAEAELEKAQRQQRTIHNQIILDVHQAYLRYEQARAELTILDGQVRPEVEAAIRRAETAYREGNTAYVIVLETTRQLLDSRLRGHQLDAELRRAWAELERSVGQHIEKPSVAVPTSDKKAE